MRVWFQLKAHWRLFKMKLYENKIKIGLDNFRKILIVISLTAIITAITYTSGGTKGAWPQLYYIVIILSAYYWDMKASLFIAVMLGLIAGPFMPQDVQQGIMQEPQNWMLRLMIYSGISIFVGYVLQRNRIIDKQLRDKDLIDEFTGLHNTNKLSHDLDLMLNENKDICLIFFSITNLDDIGKYLSYSKIQEITKSYIARVQSKYRDNEIYSINFNEYVLVLEEYDALSVNETVSKNLEDILKPVEMDSNESRLITKVGIAFCSEAKLESAELIRMARTAASQGEKFDSGVYTFDYDFDQERRLFHEISSSIQEDINNDKFYLVYQPIIDLRDNNICSAEVLARWDRGIKKPVGPNIFIKIAEETGFIHKITKEVVKQHIENMLTWEKSGFKIKSSINITAHELIDESLINDLRELVEAKQLDKSYLGIEITERVFSVDEIKLDNVLKALQAKGYFISIDDFGTGYNTLKNLKEIRADIIKIDKYFIDLLDDMLVRNLVKHIIELVHEMGLLVVAEGVETKEQLDILKQLNCDKIQGYYFSKPLLPDDFVDFCHGFKMDHYVNS